MAQRNNLITNDLSKFVFTPRLDMIIVMRMIMRINTSKEFIVQIHLTSSAKKGRLSLSINQDLLDRFEPYKQQVNFSAQAEQMLARILEELENRAWVERNSEALSAHGRDIAVTGLAGAEFDRI